MRSKITDRQSADYWQKRVGELEAMRPLEPREAQAKADDLIREAERVEAMAERILAKDHTISVDGMGIGWILEPKLAAQELRANREHAGSLVKIARDLRDEAKAYAKIASQPLGQALEESLAEARARRDYYLQKLEVTS